MFCLNCGTKNEEGYKFCVSCGADLVTGELPPKNEINEQRQSDASEFNPNIEATENVVFEESEYSENEEYLASEYKGDSLKKSSKKNKPLIIGGLILVFLIIIVAGTAFLYFTGFFDKGIFSAPEKLIYTVQESSDTGKITEIYSIRPNGNDLMEIFSDPDGVNLVNYYVSYFQDANIAKNKDFFAVYSNENEEIVLIPISGQNQIYVEIDLDGRTFFPIGFSPSGKYYGYVLSNFSDTTDNSLIFIDMQGNQIAEFLEYSYGSYDPNEDKMIAYKAEGEDKTFSSLYLIDINTGSEEWIGEIESDGLVGAYFPTTSDGKSIFVTDEDGINKITIKDNISSQIYDAKGMGIPIPITDNNKLLILDYVDGYYDLYVLDLKKNSKLRVDKYLNLSARNNSESNFLGIVLSEDEKNILYTVSDEGNDIELHLASLDGKNHTQIDRGSNLYGYEFSPDKKHIAYIEYNSNNQGGTLNVCDIEGNNKVRIDSDVWSFQFTNNGRNIVYSKVEDLERGRPVSELFSVKVNGKDSKSIFQPYDGLITLLLNTR